MPIVEMELPKLTGPPIQQPPTVASTQQPPTAGVNPTGAARANWHRPAATPGWLRYRGYSDSDTDWDSDPDVDPEELPPRTLPYRAACAQPVGTTFFFDGSDSDEKDDSTVGNLFGSDSESETEEQA